MKNNLKSILLLFSIFIITLVPASSISAGLSTQLPSPIQAQSLDTLNTKTILNADASPGSAWVGDWAQTRSKGIVRQLVVIATNHTTPKNLGGIFTFQYGEDGVNAVISEERNITDFQTVRDFDLLNAGEYFRVMFEPNETLDSTAVFVTTTSRRQNDGAFVRLADQQIERSNAALGQIFAYGKAFDPVTGKSVNIQPFNAIHTDKQIPSSEMTAGQEFIGDGWIDTQQIGHFVYLMAGTEKFETVSLIWSDDGIAENGAVTNITNVPILASGLNYNVYLEISNIFTSGRFVKARIVNGDTLQSAAQVGIFTVGKDAYIPLIGTSEDISILLQAVMTRSIIVGIDPDGAFKNVPVNRAGSLLVSEFDTEIALGNVDGYKVDTNFGRVKGIDAADNAVDIWAFADDAGSPRADTKIFPKSNVTLYVTSSSASDTSVNVTVDFINGSRESEVAYNITLNGQTPVSIGTTGYDVNQIYVSGPTAAVGKIYATNSSAFTSGSPDDVGTVLAIAPAGYQQSQLSHFTVPLNKKLVMKNVFLSISRASGAAGSADVTLRVKPLNQASRIMREYFPTNSQPITNGIQNLVIEAGSQIVWRVDDVSDMDTQISVIWEYKLIDQ